MRSIILKPEEKVVMLFRSSPAVLFRYALLTFVVLLLVLWYTLKYQLFAVYGVWAFLLICLTILWFFQKYYLWHREKYIITTERLVKTVHESMFRQVVSETSLDRILNISFRSTGPWSVVAGFGDIDVQVVGRLEPIVVRSVNRPAVVKEFIWRLHEQAVKSTGKEHAKLNEYAKPNQPIE